MFLAKKKRIYGNCPSCHGDYLIYRFRSFDRAYFSCAKCGYAQTVFDPWDPELAHRVENAKKIMEVYSTGAQAKAGDHRQLEKLLTTLLENQMLTDRKVDLILRRLSMLNTAKDNLPMAASAGENPESQVEILEKTADDEQYLSTLKAAELLGLTSKNAYKKVLNLISKGKLKAKKPGRSFIIARSELEKFKQENNL